MELVSIARLAFSFKSYLPCLLTPCQNNGTCSLGPNGTALCSCSNWYGGLVCQRMNYCCLHVCGSNRLCLPGANCTLLNPWASLPRANNGSVLSSGIYCKFSSVFSSALGTCVYMKETKFQCLCPPGGTSLTYTTMIHPCHSNPCRNNEQCLSLEAEFTCVCLLGFDGTLCDVLINLCGSNPCTEFSVSSWSC